jgi:hypothetical protein
MRIRRRRKRGRRKMRRRRRSKGMRRTNRRRNMSGTNTLRTDVVCFTHAQVTVAMSACVVALASTTNKTRVELTGGS